MSEKVNKKSKISENKYYNIYYINFQKVYEISSMMNNLFSLKKEVSKDEAVEGEGDLKARLGLDIFGMFNLGEAEASGKIRGSSTNKVIETFEIKTTKSILLNEIIENSLVLKKLTEVKEGQLIKIDNVSLSIENETELRSVKLFRNDIFKGLVVPGANGLDINNVFNSMFKDYSYKIEGELEVVKEKILIKIPLTYESEFESSYGVDDLFIGKVSVLGIYKGLVKANDIKNSYEYFKDVGGKIQRSGSVSQQSDISNSQYTDEIDNGGLNESISNSNSEYHYIDLLAIIQNIEVPNRSTKK